ncbi:S-methyl-5-thioribose-1-phosphate isomerase [Homalodisca vitripennis]|nr:S-methyl-5-thioribose-1-phosphate isomerase [Homalodisca vitripennis]
METQVRGAPAIAIVGCLSLAVELQRELPVEKKRLRREIEGKLNYLVSARPTAVNMKTAAEYLISLVNQLDQDERINSDEMKAKFIEAIEEMPKKDLADNQAIGEAGADAILARQENDGPVRILTHCNTGSLATSAYGTALGIVRSLFARDKIGLQNIDKVIHIEQYCHWREPSHLVLLPITLAICTLLITCTGLTFSLVHAQVALLTDSYSIVINPYPAA